MSPRAGCGGSRCWKAWRVAFKAASPVRWFASYMGQRNYPGMLRTASARVGVITVLVAVCLAACSAEETDPPPLAATSQNLQESQPQTPQRTHHPTVWEYCGGEEFENKPVAYVPNGATYSGSGIHPTVLLKFGAEKQEPQLPDKWGPSPQEGWADAQLVVCEYTDFSYIGRQVYTCAYDGVDGRETVPVTSERYIYRVFEAKTARLIRKLTLMGSTSRDQTCPFYTIVPTKFQQTVRSKDLVSRLRPLVEGPAAQ